MLIQETANYKKTEEHVSQHTIVVCKVYIGNIIIGTVSIDTIVIGR